MWSILEIKDSLSYFQDSWDFDLESSTYVFGATQIKSNYDWKRGRWADLYRAKERECEAVPAYDYEVSILEMEKITDEAASDSGAIARDQGSCSIWNAH